MKIVIVGGGWGGNDDVKRSSVIDKFAQAFCELTGEIVYKHNGGYYEDLTTTVEGADLVLWMPDMPNTFEKVYPKKKAGAVLICSKVLRPDRDRGDAVARVFKMNGNAVIATTKDEKPFRFEVIDALANKWSDTTDLKEVAESILALYHWTKASVRLNSKESPFASNEIINLDGNIMELCDIVHTVADKVENERGGRYFGNVSTRCAGMFPSMRVPNNIILMSARNSPKTHLTWEDFVPTKLVDNTVLFHGKRKPSVDAPIQLSIYEKYPDINFLIHGHAYIEGIEFTDHYYPCGDMREFGAICNSGVIMRPEHGYTFFLNLKNHGFLIGARTIENLKFAVENIDFEYRELYKPLERDLSIV